MISKDCPCLLYACQPYAEADEVHGAAEAHALGQRSTVRLVAAAEREAADLAANAIEVVRASRQLLQQYGSECTAVVAEMAHHHQTRADDRINAALGYVREAEARAEAAEALAERNAAEARRARAAAERAGAGSAAPSSRGKEVSFSFHQGGSDGDAGVSSIGATSSEITKRLRQAQFQLLGVAMWRKATMSDRAEARSTSCSRCVLKAAFTILFQHLSPVEIKKTSFDLSEAPVVEHQRERTGVRTMQLMSLRKGSRPAAVAAASGSTRSCRRRLAR